MKHRLYIDNLPLAVTLASLTEFCSVAQVDAINIVIDQRTGQPEGHAFVEMATEEAAVKAVQELNNRSLEGNRITVTLAGPIAGLTGFSGRMTTKERKNR